MKGYFQIFVALLMGIASIAVTTFVIVWVVDQQPYAHKADITTAVKQAAVTASNQTHREQAKQDVASAVVSGVVNKNGVKLKSTTERLHADEVAISNLYKRVDELRKRWAAQQDEIAAMRVRK